MSRALRIAGFVPALLAYHAWAMDDLKAETVASLDVGLSAGAATNPFLFTDGDTESLSASVTLSPRVAFIEPASTFSLSGDFRFTEYERLYSSTENYRVAADGDWAINPRSKFSAGISYSQSITGENGLAIASLDDPPPIIDPTLVGLRAKQRAFRSEAGFEYQPDPRQRWALNLFASDVEFDRRFAGNDYAFFGETLSYDRLSARGSVGGSLGLQRYECRSGPSCYTITAQPQLTASRTLSATWTLRGAVGVGISKFRLPGERRTTVNGSGFVEACRKDARSNLCLSAAQTFEATGLNGSRPVLRLGVSSSYRLSERDTLAFNASYATSTQSSPRFGNFDLFSARISGSRQLSERLYFTVGSGYTNSKTRLIGRRDNFDVSLGLRFTIGRRP